MNNLLQKLYIILWEYRKSAALCIAAVIIFSVYDVMFDILFSFIHTTFEWIEFALEETIEIIFHTSRQQTQAIVFYLLFSAGIYGCYRVYLKLNDLYLFMKAKARFSWAKYKTLAVLFWNQQSSLKKFRLLLSGSAGFAILAFLAFS
ncbi:MAG: hypothetical protein ACU83O_12690 [Gammaproteobacteria bacterium]